MLILKLFLSLILLSHWSTAVSASGSAKAWMGVAIEKGPVGIKVKSVIKDTPAMKAGLQQDDEITKINDQVVQTPEQMISVINQFGVGFSITVTYLRNGLSQQSSMALEAKPDGLEMLKKRLVNSKAPPFKTKEIFSNSEISPASGKVSILMFWATWCPACKATIPLVKEFAESNKNGKIQLIMISTEDKPTLTRFFGSALPHVDIISDATESISSDYQISALPTFVLINSQGQIVDVALGGGSYFMAIADAAKALTN